MHLPRPVGREDDKRRFGGAHRPELGNRDLELREQLEQVSFELLVSAIDLVDQQDRGTRPRGVDRLQQRPLDQERFAVQLPPSAGAVQLPGGFENAQLDELPGVVPLVDGVGDVESFVALQPDEIGLERCGDRSGQRGLPDAGLSFDKQRPTEPKRQEEGDGEAVVGDVVLRGQALLQFLDGAAEDGVHAWCGRIACRTRPWDTRPR